MADDFLARAMERTQAEFAAAHPHPFLLGAAGANLRLGPMPTIRSDDPEVIAALRKAAVETPGEPLRPHVFGDSRLVLPVRKIQGSFPSMITVGRTRNNDVVLADPMISKFHAYFRFADGSWSLADAGSVNGTRIGDTTLPPKGPPTPLQFGDRVSFGDRVLTFLDAAGTWSALRQRR